VVTFLSNEFFAELNNYTGLIDFKDVNENVCVAYRVVNTPIGEVDYYIKITDRGVSYHAGRPDEAAPIIAMHYETAKAILENRLSVNDAIANGYIRLGGNISHVSKITNALKLAGDVFASFRDKIDFDYGAKVRLEVNAQGNVSDKVLSNAQDEAQDEVVPEEKENPMEILSSRILLRPTNLDRSLSFYGNDLGLAVYREFGVGQDKGVVFFLGGGFLEISGRSGTPAGPNVSLWLQVRDIDEAYQYLQEKGVLVSKKPKLEPWGLKEMWVNDPDGVRLYIVEVPEDHPLRRREEIPSTG
jgi:predicted enzyme related to lactoylglutathione lyase